MKKKNRKCDGRISISNSVLDEDMIHETVMGLDPGIANFGWAIYKTDGSFDTGVIRTEKEDNGFARLSIIDDAIFEIFNKYFPDVAVMEQMMLNQISKSKLLVYAASMVVGTTLEGIRRNENIPLVFEINPKSTKKKLGVETKKEMKKLVGECFEIPNSELIRMTEHEADSLGNIILYIKDTEAGEYPNYDKIMEIFK
jgi:Holliday junction resolvasome RuvABC endonuclease subunit